MISQISTNYCVYQLGTKILHTLHKTLHFLCISLILRTLHCVGFETKILHKSYMESYMGTKSQRDEETKRRGLPQPLPKGKGFVAALMHRTWGSFFGESKRRREEKWERGRERKTMGRLRKTMGRLRKTMGRERKTRGRLRKTRGRERKIRGSERKI